MRRACTGLVLVLLGGCFWAAPGRPGAIVERLKPMIRPDAAGPADGVFVDVVPIEQPIGDRYLNDGLWAVADEQIMELDRKAVLEENGFRVGLVSGILPAEFLALLTDDRGPERRRHQMRAGQAKSLPFGDARPVFRFQVHADDKVTPVELTQVRCALQVTPTLLPDGAVKLAFVPLVQHGAKVLWPLSADRDSSAGVQRSTESYPALGWEVTLTSNDYVVIGTRDEQSDTLGHVCFLSTDGPKAVQRVLAIRASRLVPEATPDNADAPRRAPAVPPLALQAATTSGGRE